MKITVGCGSRNFGKDWYHVDGAKLPHVDSNDVWLKNLTAETADLIYSSHFIEYFDRQEGLELLKAWYKVLKPGGTLRLAVPDFEKLSKAVNYRGFKLKDILGPLYGRMEMNGQLIYHKTVYDVNDLKETLIAAGFRDPKKYEWRTTEHAQFDDQSQAYLPKMAKDTGYLISLNVEAIK